MAVTITNLYDAVAITPSLLVGLMGYWQLDETSGTTANDELGTNNLTISGATVNVAGKLGRCCTFVGSESDYIGNVDAMDPTAAISVSCWIKSSTTTNYESPVGNYHWDGNGWDLIRIETAGTLEWSIRNSVTTSNVVEGSHNVADGTWHHVVGTYDGSNIRLYVNGSQDGSTVAHSAAIRYTASNRFCIGTRELEDNHWTGQVDEVGVWSRALTAGEITTLYNGGTGLTYPF